MVRGLYLRYHMVLGGFVLAEVLQRRDPHRRTLGQIVKEDICDPLDLDFMIGARLAGPPHDGPSHTAST